MAKRQSLVSDLLLRPSGEAVAVNELVFRRDFGDDLDGVLVSGRLSPVDVAHVNHERLPGFDRDATLGLQRLTLLRHGLIGVACINERII